MSLFGKILAVLNVLAAIGFVYLLALDLGQRQRWAYAVYRHDLAIDGFPLDEQDKEPTGTPRVNRLSRSTVEEIFQGHEPVTTQMDEVKRVQLLLQERVNSADIKGTREQKLARLLLPLAVTFSERQALLRWATGRGEGKGEDLEKRFNAVFEEVEEVRHTPDGQEVLDRNGKPALRTMDERKRAVAHLLFCLAGVLSEDPASAEGGPEPNPLGSSAYNRMLSVVGLAAAVGEVDKQSIVLEELASQAVRAVESERDLYVRQHLDLVHEIQNQATDLLQQQQFLEKKKDEAARQEEDVKKRTETVKQQKKQLEDTRKATQDLLAQQAALDQQTYDRLKALRDTMARNEYLLREIEKLEMRAGRSASQ